MLEQIRCRDQELEINNRRTETVEAEKTQLMREIETINDKIEKLERNKNDKIKYEESYVAELQTKLDASRESELLSLGRLARMSGGRRMLYHMTYIIVCYVPIIIYIYKISITFWLRY